MAASFYPRTKKPRNRRGANPTFASQSWNVHSRGVIPEALAGVDPHRSWPPAEVEVGDVEIAPLQ